MADSIREIQTEQDYDLALQEIGQYFEKEPIKGTMDAERFDVLAHLIEAYEATYWPICSPLGPA
jgi:HTH-type transcriptional regulator/antitoxin HigA